THQNEIQITYSAKADSETVLNLTNHAYFNLGGEVNDYLLTIPSTTIIESNVHLIPSGKLEDISNTALDFSKAKIGYRKNQSIPGALFENKGYAVCYVLNSSGRNSLCATVKDPQSGRILEMFTDQRCLQFYDGWLMDGSDIGKFGKPYQSCAGLALEAMGFPDAPNQPHFPSIVIGPAKEYQQT